MEQVNEIKNTNTKKKGARLALAVKFNISVRHVNYIKRNSYEVE